MNNGVARRRAAAATRDAKGRSRQAPGWKSKPTSKGAVSAPAAGSPEAVEGEALVVTHWFDPGEAGEPYSATVRLRGQRVGIRGMPKRTDTFTQEDTIDRIVPGSGPVSITSWLYGLAAGEWSVAAELMRHVGPWSGHRPSDRGRRLSTEPARRATWSWRRWAVSTGPATPVKTRWARIAPLATMPAVVPGIWPALAAFAILVGLSIQAVILAHEDLSVGKSLVVSVPAVALGLVGAKLWNAVLHPGPWRQWIQGWAVDGFLVVALAVAVAALLALNVSVGLYLDAGTPGLFLAVAIGRLGCFFAGCCAGRCTRSRWGVWSSDRRVGARRIPAQLLESAAGLLIGIVAALLVLSAAPAVEGAIFAAAFTAYILARQLLLRVRAEPRRYSWRRGSLAGEPS